MDITDYLARHERKDLLRILTCGSVDDGKSTLIGRLLFDAHLIYEDQIAAIRKDTLIHGTTGTDFDPALLTDGLQAEREQGITIDVAYRYFSTDQRKFIIADTPGHEQYTRNMATGASHCTLAVVLIDARHGIVTQTRRHSFIASLLGIKHVVVAVNKMDLVDWSEQNFEDIRADYNAAIARMDFVDIHFIPLCALHGDNVAQPSRNMNWYQGPTLLHHLERVNISTDRNLVDLRFPIQIVLRPDSDFRGFAGTIVSGILRINDPVMCLPSRVQTRVTSILTPSGEVDEACPPLSVTVSLEDPTDVSRGCMLVHPNNQPKFGADWEAMLVWMDAAAAQPGQAYLLKHTTNTVPATLDEIRYRIDINTMRKADASRLEMNEIGRVRLSLHRPLPHDDYTRNPQTGNFILIDRLSHATVAAGMILDRPVAPPNEKIDAHRPLFHERPLVTPAERAGRFTQHGATLWLTGLSGSGKSAIAKELERALFDRGCYSYVLDGDNMRQGLNKDLGFSAEDRRENIRRIAEVAALFTDAGWIVIAPCISPYLESRDQARSIIGSDRFLEIYVSTPLDVCEARDPKQLYARARAGEIPHFTGVSAPYEAPLHPDMELNTEGCPLPEAVHRLLAELQRRGFIRAPSSHGNHDSRPPKSET